jgi:hypothetical protein
MKVLAAVILLLSMKTAQAAKIVTIHGSSCGAWTQERRTQSVKYAQMEGWAMGFVSGWVATWGDAHQIAEPLGNLDQAALLEWVNNYCTAHPLESLSNAVYGLTGELEKRQRPN